MPAWLLRPGKEEVRVYDDMDGAVPMLAKMHEKRMKGLKTLGAQTGGTICITY